MVMPTPDNALTVPTLVGLVVVPIDILPAEVMPRSEKTPPEPEELIVTLPEVVVVIVPLAPNVMVVAVILTFCDVTPIAPLILSVEG